MLFHVLLLSIALGSVLLAINLIWLHNKDVEKVETALRLVEEHTLPTVTNAIWLMDEEQVKSLINGILLNPDFVGVQIYNESRQLVFNVENENESYSSYLTRDYPLISINQNPQTPTLGFLRVIATKEKIYDRLIEQALIMAVSSFVLGLILSLVYLSLFKNRVTRHLKAIQEYFVTTIQHNRYQALQLKKAHEHVDEFSRIQEAINEAISRFSTAQREQRERLSSNEKDLEMKEQITSTLMQDRSELQKAISDTHTELKQAKRDLMHYSHRLGRAEQSQELANDIGTKTNSLSVAIHELESKNHRLTIQLEKFAQRLEQGQDVIPLDREQLLTVFREYNHHTIATRRDFANSLKELQSGIKDVNDTIFTFNQSNLESSSKDIIQADSFIEDVISFLQENHPDWYFIKDIQDGIRFQAERYRLFNIFIHLITHSSKSYGIDEEVQIFISLGETESMVQFIISDQGKTFSETELSAFLSKDQTKINNFFYAASYVNLLRGSLEFLPNAPKGTRICLSLPKQTALQVAN
ncbi:signal transduction protein with periplasmic or extracellular sensor domain [Pseudobacteriovorax antillogorgiicola]|uniref:Signal transduction protein with periplasmic or extracellular sensor domain n=2 Tax=Pseudobacteriovorax antillogorgiicola TaxID=1513793 RepID=A0A1Y6BC35_9BACT|nr:signal transduction protein with periplasmic or extracellular sensor domain [Pseudobacteriovorax antillogorgiicola]SME96361.1 signal transduction protein with periplasmic or extracellular sensor domain [Pseudobacteriovorax antillogorgiicola]